MTANMIKGKGFRGALKYSLDKVDKKAAEVLDHNFASLSEKAILKEVQMIKVLRPNLEKFFYHTSINFPYEERLSNDLMKQIGLDYLDSSSTNTSCFVITMRIIRISTSWSTGLDTMVK